MYSFELTAEELLHYVKSMDNSSELFSDIRSEFELGATIVFVKPVVGSPLGGFILRNLLSN